MESLIFKILLFAPPLLIAVILHEIAHGYVAYRLGDPTAKSLGRLSLNPIRHIDPMMTIILPGLLIALGSKIIFGGAKPVPVNPLYFKNPRYGMVLVAIAGPVVNFILAGACLSLFVFFIKLGPLLMFLPEMVSSLLLLWCVYGILVNLVLALFNLVPIPPLDGGRIAVGLLPRSLALPLARLERYGLLIVFLLLYTGIIERYLGGALGLFARGVCSFQTFEAVCKAALS